MKTLLALALLCWDRPHRTRSRKGSQENELRPALGDDEPDDGVGQREDKRERERLGRGRSWRQASESGLSPGSDLSGVLSVVPVSIDP